MDWYILRTLQGREEKILLILSLVFKEIKIIFPRRILSWRKKGQVIKITVPLFGGYLFVSTDAKGIMELDRWVRRARLDCWVVKIGKSIFPLLDDEVEVLRKLLNNGEIVDESEIIKVDSKVTIIKGPLVGLEGIVEKYCRRNRRVIVRVSIGTELRRVELEGKWLSQDF